jgi:Pvc16 N-terminal domain
MEDTSKLWSALQTHYRPSASYQASMVLIESDDAYQAEGLSMISLSQPTIEQVIAPAEPEQLIVVNSTLVIRGKRLRGEITRIRLGNSEKLLIPEDVKETQISLLVPTDLAAGVHGVQVVHLKMGNQEPKQQMESNVTSFVLHPQITATIAQVEKSAENLCSAKITVKFQPKVGKMQRLVLLLNELSNDNPGFYSFPVTLDNEDTDVITILVTDVKSGTYLVRVRVDGAESPLHINQAGEYDAPQVIIV